MRCILFSFACMKLINMIRNQMQKKKNFQMFLDFV